jgi:hypothetical protein
MCLLQWSSGPKKWKSARRFQGAAGPSGGLETPGAGTYFSSPPTQEVPMDRAEQLQFQRLPAEAQFEALWRLALSGLTVDEVSQRTGWSPERIRQHINPEPARAVAPWRTARRAKPEVHA